MQPDLPWNVAGIPPEAREAARAAARREGLSVGEWLTRRILRTFSELGSLAAPEREAWREPAAPAYREAPAQAASRDTESMLASVSRSESETQNAYKRIEEQLRSVGRRLEATERSQTENSRAMSKAATEINIATREQAQAFDQLGGHVVGLSDRLTRVEQQTAHDGLKDAVRGLHQGLSRLAEQISQTANHSADQIAALAGNVESVVGKLGEAEQNSRTLDERLAVIDERVRTVERAAHSSANAIERTLENMERAQGDKNVTTAEMQRHASNLAQLSGLLDQLNARFAASEAQTAGAMARFEDNFARLESKGHDANLDRRLLSIEHALADIAGRLESSERNSAGGNVEESVRSLAQRVDAADKRHREALAELRSAVKDANGKLATFEPAAPQAAVVPPQAAPYQAAPFQPAPPLNQPILDLPPFPESFAPQHPLGHHQTAMPPHDAFAQPPFDIPPSDPMQPFGVHHAFGADTFAAAAAQQASDAVNESFLSAARRSAREAASAEPATAPSAFSWAKRGPRPEPELDDRPRNGSARYYLIAGLAALVIVAAIAGTMLSHAFGGRHDVSATPDLSTLLTPKPAVPSAMQTEPQPTVPAYAPASPPPTADDESAATHLTPPPATQAKPITVPTVKTKAVPDGGTPKIQAPAQQAAAAQTKAQSPAVKLAALANAGNVTAQAALGFDYLDGGNGVTVNEAEAARWLERAANKGSAISAYRLGTLYERGHGVPTDAAKAMQWYTVAAKQGNRKAMHNLAVAFAEGTGVPKNLIFASQWFTRAAELGLSDSQFNLAVLYERGMGVPQSLTEAFKWYSIAAAQGDAESKARVDALATQLTPADKVAAQHAAESFQPKPLDKAANAPPSGAGLLGG